MSKKVLFVATVVKGHINAFHLPYLKKLKEEGWETHVCAKNDFDIGEDCRIPYCDRYFDIPFERSPFSSNNLSAYRQLKEIIDKNNYQLVHCHTPVGGALTRLAAREARNRGTKIIYTAHGYHFYKGASAMMWTVYYPVEKWLASYTDCQILINEDDYHISVNRHFKAERIELIPGVGVDLKRFSRPDFILKDQLRTKHGFNKDDFIMICVGELSESKNQSMLIDVMGHLKESIPNIKLLLVGRGNKAREFEEKVQNMNLQEQVQFMGYRNDVHELMALSDIAVSTSRREGLPVNVMEAMAVNLPVVVTNSRGNKDLVQHMKNGLVVELDHDKAFSEAVLKLYRSPEMRERFSIENAKMIKNYSVEEMVNKVCSIYHDYAGSGWISEEGLDESTVY
ncbi:glycosyltransferase family 4 protein [Jeotgalibacillus haloalkalitolerans]|uniref:Glycosyltransferase family 4 protein n=1 Tax=Jeotgalibacillus haloalkalitolerans TaxID=3104292 RepID=A0ABU5KI42_9BACL|nr:glycosyltransferase family 4 protein [Jeotgalibacillus sp. HH7-29]MDZ5710907.1 glycosyltransferase family 4 protein [Jeotgalibacillus sp. HH7-29]